MMDVDCTVAQVLQNIWLHEDALPPEVSARKIAGLSLDNRTLKPGEVFVAVPGSATDGRNFITRCPKHIALVIEEAGEFQVRQAALQEGGEVVVIGVPELAKKVSLLAANYYGHPSKSLTVIGITGTNGKTTCAYLLAQMLSQLHFSSAMLGTLGYGVFDQEGNLSVANETGLTTPSAVDCQRVLAEMQARTGAVVMEVSSHALAQGRVEALDFNGAVFTNLSRDHLDYHGSIEEYANVKASLFEREELGFVVVNGDDPLGKKILQQHVAAQAVAYSFSLDGVDDKTFSSSVKTIVASDIRCNAMGAQATLITPWGNALLTTTLVGRYNLSNVLAAITTACALGFDLTEVIQAAAKLRAAPGRLQKVLVDEEVKAQEQDVAVFVDYAHTPDALEKVLQEVSPYVKGNLWVVVGCGGDRDKGKRPLMAQIAEQQADRIVLTSDNPRSEDPSAILSDMVSGLKHPDMAIVIVDRKQAIEQAIEGAEKNDAIVIAGKGHENYQLIQGKKFPFDDVLVARQCLAQRVSAQLGGQL